MYSYKTEVSALPNVLAVGCGRRYAGFTVDIGIFQKNSTWYKKTFVRKTVMSYRFVMMENTTIILKITGKFYVIKNTLNYKMIWGQFSQRNFHDRTMVKNYFGSVCSFGFFFQKWRWNENCHAQYFWTVLALKNLHLLYNPLRADNSRLFDTVINCLFSIGSSIISKRSASNLRYLGARKRCTNNLVSCVDLTESFDDDNNFDLIRSSLNPLAAPEE